MSALPAAVAAVKVSASVGRSGLKLCSPISALLCYALLVRCGTHVSWQTTRYGIKLMQLAVVLDGCIYTLQIELRSGWIHYRIHVTLFVWITCESNYISTWMLVEFGDSKNPHPLANSGWSSGIPRFRMCNLACWLVILVNPFHRGLWECWQWCTWVGRCIECSLSMLEHS